MEGHRTDRGFTLIEVIAILIIAGILAALILPRFMGIGGYSANAAQGDVIAAAQYARQSALLGSGNITLSVQGLNLMGRLFMHPVYDCPFRTADAVLAQEAMDCDVILVDMHAEATSEKTAMGWHLAGRVAGVMGSHTHVPTADERVLPGGTAYQSDAGMCGCYDSVIGVDKDAAIRRFITALPGHGEAVDGVATFCGLLMTVDTGTGRCSAVRRVRYDFPQEIS